MNVARSSPTAVWLLLMVATTASWWFSAAQDGDSRRSVAAGVLVIAFAKVRLITAHFMELRTAPVLARWACDLWIAGVCIAMLSLYFLAPR